WPPDRHVAETERADLRRIEDVAAVEDHRLLHQLLHLREVRFAELIPFRDHEQGVSALQRVVGGLRVLDALLEDALGNGLRLGIERADLRAALEQSFDDRHGWRFAHVIGPRLERQAPDGDRLASQLLAELLVNARQETALLRLVDRLDSFENLEAVLL